MSKTCRDRCVVCFAVFLWAGAVLCSTSCTPTAPTHWGYEADNGPAAWGAMAPEWIL